MAKKTSKNEEKITLGDAIKLYGDKKGVILIHKYGITGNFEYKVEDIDKKLLSNEVIVVQKNAGGIKYDYDGVLYIIK